MAIHYSDEGSGEQALVLVHGFPLDRRLWRGQGPLAEGRRLIALDLPGFGDTPAGERGSMGHYAEAVVEVMDAAGVARGVLCGLSMGGYLLFELWRRHPGRVAALLLCDTRAGADDEAGRARRREAIDRVERGERRQVTEAMLPALLAPGSLSRPELLTEVRRMNGETSQRGLVQALQAMHDRPDSGATLATISVPTLVVVGEEDTLTPPAEAEAMAAAIPGAELARIPGAGHLSPLEQPEAFNRAVEPFLRRLPAGG